MSDHVIVFDLETAPDLEAVSRIHEFQGHCEAEAREALGTSSQNCRSIISCA